MGTPLFLRNFPVQIEESDVWRWLGSHGKPGDPRLAGEVRNALCSSGELIEPKAVFQRIGVNHLAADGIHLSNGENLDGSNGDALLERCAGAEEIALIVSTIGPALEGKVQELFSQGRPLEAVILDAVGSAAAAAASRYINGVIYNALAEEGIRGGQVLHPGSHYWDLLGQRTLFAILPVEQIGVTLTPSCLILPRKSSSGAIPAGRELINEHKPSERDCRQCPNLKCIARWEESQLLTPGG